MMKIITVCLYWAAHFCLPLNFAVSAVNCYLASFSSR